MVNQDQPQVDTAPQLGTFVLDIYVPEVVLGKQVDVNDLPRHMIVRDPTIAAMLWVLLFMAKEDGMIETGSPVWVGRER